ncbi:24555_t:CDS:2 [Dentiscutata erythropus]|uniref:24555_t:CDS:1 n=1 Tax=Dentiscutata erythropus TaxID=1348616 RepID=A0A9N9D4Y8_9GLOM|nr:24555_t:CDS:2 [Dentiscutata erythropus]
MHELVIDFTDSTVLQEIDSYREINNALILIKKILNNNQIVETVLAEQLEYKQGDLDDSDKELPKITATEKLNRLKTFISFTEQMYNNFFFLNYFFKTPMEDQIMFNKYSANFPYNNNFSDDNDDFFGDNFSDNYFSKYDFLNDNFSNNNFSDDDFPDNDFPDDDFSDDNFPNNNNNFSNKDFFGDNNFPNCSSFPNNYDNYSDDYEK